MMCFSNPLICKRVLTRILSGIKTGLLIFLGFSYAAGQTFRHFSGEEEFSPRGAILSITQDSEGFMWFASPRGLYRYDGRSFKKYGRPLADSASASPLYVHCVQSDSKGNIWAGTVEGLYLYDKEKDVFSIVSTHDPLENNSLSHNQVYTIFEDKRKQLWAGTPGGLDLITFTDGNVKIARKLPAALTGRSRAVRSIAEEPDGTLWLGTYDGLIRFRSESDTKLFKRTSKVPSTVLNQFVEVFVDKKGTVWVGSNEPGLVKFDKADEAFVSVESFRDPVGNLPVVNKICVDSRGRYWLATESGLARYDPDGNSSHWYRRDASNPYSLSDNVLYSQFIDNQGGLWLGSYYWGVNYWHPDSPMFSIWPAETHAVPYDHFLNGWAGSTPNGSTWTLSNDRRSLLIMAKNQEQSRLYTLTIPTPEIYHLFMLDTNGVFWCAGQKGLCRVDLKRNSTKFFSLNQTTGRTNSLTRDQSGVIWLGGSFGLRKFNELNGTFETVKTIKNEVRGVFEDSQKKIWVGCKEAVFLISSEGALIDSCETDDYLNKFVEDTHGNIWSVVNKTLVKFDSKENRLTFEKVLTGEFWGIEIDKNGSLWLCEDTKLKRFDPDKKLVQTFGYREGLPLNSLLGYSDPFKDGESFLYFTTNNEIFRFDPAANKSIDSQSPVVLTSLKLFNRQVSMGDKTGILEKPVNQTRTLRFRHDQNVFALDFSLLSFFKSDANQFAYRLKGFDKDWNLVSIPSATYTNLPPGTYEFQAKAANGDGIWTNKPLELAIIILPPWWKTWYAYLFYFLFAAAAVYGVTRFFWLRSAFEKENELYQSKIDFFTNISHEIRTHLTLISGPLEKAFQSSLTGSDTRNFLTYTKNNTDKLLHLVNELLDFRKMQSGKTRLQVAEHDVVRVIRNVLAAFEHVADEKEISVDIVAPENRVLLWFDRSQLQKVFYNLLGNAFKFTPDNGRVRIVINEGFNEVTITITDNGPGIAPKYLGRIFTSFFQVNDNGSNSQNTGYGIGLALSRSIIDRHRGDLSVTSRQKSDSGYGETTFTIRLMTGNWYSDDSDIVVALSDSTAVPPQTNDYPVSEQDATSDRESTLLIIEDNDELRSFAVELFRDSYRVLEAADGRNGLSIAQKHMPDVIVCDVMMPEMNGLEVCRKLRSDFTTRHIPIILISARSAAVQMLEGLESGADDYLIKPFDFKILDAKIRTQLRTREAVRLQYSRIVSFGPGPLEIKDPDSEFIEKLRDLVVQNLSDTGFGVEQMAFQMGASVSVLYRKLRALTGMTVNSFTKNIRMKRARQLLESGHYNVSEVANEVGYDDTQYFSREYKKTFGKAPSETRKTGLENNSGGESAP